MTRYKLLVKEGYATKAFEFINYNTLSDLIRCMVIGADEVEFAIRKEEEADDEREIDRRLP